MACIELEKRQNFVKIVFHTFYSENYARKIEKCPLQCTDKVQNSTKNALLSFFDHSKFSCKTIVHR